MGQVVYDVSVSLDGFTTGPNDGPGQGLGEGGERLHEWLFDLASWHERHGRSAGSQSPDSEMLEEAFEAAGAVVMGRRMFDLAEEPWGDDPPFRTPCFVVTHRAHDRIEKAGGTSFTFVTDGVESAVAQAKEAAGGKGVSVAGGANVAQQGLRAGLVDEIHLHVVPLLLGDGVPLFGPDTAGIELEKTRVADSTGVTHMWLRVVR
jgi:dihydrofolate reductase